MRDMDQIIKAVIVAALFLGYLGVLVVIILHPVAAGSQGTVQLIIGALGNSVGIVVGYYFGSSSSSQKKDETLQEIAKAP
jgi:hypothetical protein